MSYAARVNEIFLACLFSEEEIAGLDEDKIEASRVPGITVTVGFNPKRLNENKPYVKALVEEIVPPAFFAQDGASFFGLAETRTGDLWAEHQTMQEFMLLAIGCGYAKYVVPKPAWRLLPGGMPYVQFYKEEGTALKVVRLYDMMDGWIDITGPITEVEATRIWNEKTHKGTKNTKYEDGDYYAIYPADTKMVVTPEYLGR